MAGTTSFWGSGVTAFCPQPAAIVVKIIMAIKCFFICNYLKFKDSKI
jgi:hypothetical protein